MEAEWRDAFDRLQERLFSSYATQASLFEALETADFLQSAPGILERARSLEPAPGYEQDHRHWIAFLSNMAQGDRYREAISERDLLGVLRALDEGDRTTLEFLTNVSPAFCEALVANEPDRRSRCPLPSDADVTEYERDVYEAVRVFALTTANSFAFPLDMTQAQRSERLREVQPRIEQALESLRSQIEPLTPPPGLEPDHEALVTYIGEQLQTAEQITRANIANDHRRIQELFMRSNTVFNDLSVSISEDFRPILAPLLAEPAS